MVKVSTKIHLPEEVSTIDLGHWIRTLSDEEYQSCSVNHIAMGMSGENTAINVESIGGHLMIHHYTIEESSVDSIKLVSPQTLAYIFHIIPVHIKVVWEVKKVREENKLFLQCRITAIFPNKFLDFLSTLFLVKYFVKKHDNEETQKFAHDMVRKVCT